jgi:energy-coupling factor transporter ATP-binding protein EcfA2
MEPSTPISIIATAPAPRSDVPVILPTPARRGPPRAITTAVLADFAVPVPLGIIRGGPAANVLLVGGPGAGKTTALRLAAGLPPATGKRLRLTGGPLPPPGSGHYIGATDVHEPALSVRETLAFALACSDASLQLPLGSLLALFGLDGVADDRAGKLSASEVRRLSVAEGMVAALHRAVASAGAPVPLRVVAVDGLTDHQSPSEAAATTQAVASLAASAGLTLFATARSPPSSVLMYFPRVVALAEGHTLYDGPREGLAAYLSGSLTTAAPTAAGGDDGSGHVDELLPLPGPGLGLHPPPSYALAPGLLAQLLVDDPVGTAALYADDEGAAGEGLPAVFAPAALAARWRAAAPAGAAAHEPSGKTAPLVPLPALAAAIATAAASPPSPPRRLGATALRVLAREVTLVARSPLYWLPGLLLPLFVALLLGILYYHSIVANTSGRAAAALLGW